jgi:predicted alpha/beta superfamily hydrolase
MKQLIITTILTVFTTFSYGQKTDTIIIQSKVFAANRQLIVYTPHDYQENTKQYFEVIYVLDAQVHFMTELVVATNFFVGKTFFAPIVVGIVSEDRGKDFLPKNENKETFEKKQGHLGDAEKLLDFLKDEAVPYIDKNYRTLPTKVILGHSLAATFVSYCLLESPNLFDGYIAISPNLEYDKYQFVKRFDRLQPKNINEQKFLYMCNSNEEIDFSKDWKIGRDKVIQRLSRTDLISKVKFINDDFSKSDDHSTVYPIGVKKGLKGFFDYYHNADKLTALYEKQSKMGKYDLTSDRANYMAYNFLWSHKPKEALKIIQWANKLFPDDLNIYASMGEIYQENRDTANAFKSYSLLIQKLEMQKDKISIERYNELKAGVADRIKNVSPKK